MIDFLDVGDVLAMQIDVMGRLGRWETPIRDLNALGATIEAIEASARRDRLDLTRIGAMYAVQIAQLRPFEDANLPTAFAEMQYFLALNGSELPLGSYRRLAQYLRLVAEEHDSHVATSLFETRLRSALTAQN